jgi:hypothetical protein
MKSKKSLHPFFSYIIVLSVLSLAGCNNLELDSKWREREITIDGIDAEWRNALLYIEKAKASVGVANDERYIYICLVSVDRTTGTQMARLGFTVWFDHKGGKEKTFGIHFPLGMQEGEHPLRVRESMQDPDKYQKMFEDLGNEIEIIGPGKGQRVRMSRLLTQGIEVELGYSKGRLVYELKVPLDQSAEHPYAIGTDTDKQIGLGFETPELDREKMGQMMGQRGGGIGRGGGGMGRRGGRGSEKGGGGEMRQGGEIAEPFELWAKVTLASESSSVQP